MFRNLERSKGMSASVGRTHRARGAGSPGGAPSIWGPARRAAAYLVCLLIEVGVAVREGVAKVVAHHAWQQSRRLLPILQPRHAQVVTRRQ